MTENVPHENMEPFQNPDLVPLEELKLEVKTDGVVTKIDALNKAWASDRYFLHYEAPKIYNDEQQEITGAKDYWMKIVNYMIADLKWLLSLPFYRFWSNIIYNKSILDALVSFLQDAPPFYALENFPNCPQMLELLDTVSRYVLMVFTRLVTNRESYTEYMTQRFLGNLMYENYVFTVPIIFDLCQLYGRENAKIMEKLLNCLFTLELRYNNDLQRTVPCLLEALENIERLFNDSAQYTGEAVSLSNRNTGPTKLTLFNLEDMILYVLDISSTITVFLRNYRAAVSIYHREDFMNKIVSIYETTIPELYKHLDKLGRNDDNMPKYMELKHRLDVTRVEILNLFRIIIHEPILSMQENLVSITEADMKERVEEYLIFLTNAISEKEFITDYDQFYPVAHDLTTQSNVFSEIDPVKCDYILQSISASIGRPVASSVTFCNDVAEAVAGPSGIQNQSASSTSKISSSNGRKTCIMKNSVEWITLISEVKDIFNNLDEHFIEMCLEYYDYDSASVIDAVLENNLPPKLKELKDLGSMTNSVQMDLAQSDYMETVNDDVTYNIGALNLADDDDDHVKPHDIEVAKDYITKNYSLVVDDYEDEYDDTYDNSEVRGAAHDDSVEMDSRPFTTPRVLLGKQKVETVNESESEDESAVDEQNGKDHFIQNPAELRAKAEQRRQAMRGGRGSSNVTGNPKGRGQEKDVLQNRHQKNTHKATHANHNRRMGAQRKRNQGMVPS